MGGRAGVFGRVALVHCNICQGRHDTRHPTPSLFLALSCSLYAVHRSRRETRDLTEWPRHAEQQNSRGEETQSDLIRDTPSNPLYWTSLSLTDRSQGARGGRLITVCVDLGPLFISRVDHYSLCPSVVTRLIMRALAQLALLVVVSAVLPSALASNFTWTWPTTTAQCDTISMDIYGGIAPWTLFIM